MAVSIFTSDSKFSFLISEIGKADGGNFVAMIHQRIIGSNNHWHKTEESEWNGKKKMIRFKKVAIIQVKREGFALFFISKLCFTKRS